jgi:hypothetical protein
MGFWDSKNEKKKKKSKIQQIVFLHFQKKKKKMAAPPKYFKFEGVRHTPKGKITQWKLGKNLVDLPANVSLDSPLVKRSLEGHYIKANPSRREMHQYDKRVKKTGGTFKMTELSPIQRNAAIKNSQHGQKWFDFGFKWGYEIAVAVTDEQAIAALKVEEENLAVFQFWPALRVRVPGLPYYSWNHIGDDKHLPWLLFQRNSYLCPDPSPLDPELYPFYEQAGLTDYRGYNARFEEELARLKGYAQHVGDVVRNETGVTVFEKDTVYVGVREQTGVLLLPNATAAIKTEPNLVLVEASRWSDSQLWFVFKERYPPGKLSQLPPVTLEGDPAMLTFIPEHNCGFSGFRFFHRGGESRSVQWPPSSPQASLRKAILANTQGEIQLSDVKRDQTVLCFNFEILVTVKEHLGLSEPETGDMVVVHGRMLQGPLIVHPESFQVDTTKNLSLPSVATFLNICLFSTYAGGKVENLVLAFPTDFDRQLVVPFIQFGEKVHCITF